MRPSHSRYCLQAGLLQVAASAGQQSPAAVLLPGNQGCHSASRPPAAAAAGHAGKHLGLVMDLQCVHSKIRLVMVLQCVHSKICTRGTCVDNVVGRGPALQVAMKQPVKRALNAQLV
jgi:hypothetical protein